MTEHTAQYITNHYAGVVESRKRQLTGTVITVYRNDEAGLDDDGGLSPYSTVCETHGAITTHESLSLALKHAPWGSGCEDCEKVVREAPPKTPKLTRREEQVIHHVLDEARVYRKAASGLYQSKDSQAYYRGMAAAMNRLADEVLNGLHRQ